MKRIFRLPATVVVLTFIASAVVCPVFAATPGAGTLTPKECGCLVSIEGLAIRSCSILGSTNSRSALVWIILEGGTP